MTATTYQEPLRSTLLSFLAQYERDLPTDASLDAAHEQARRLFDKCLSYRPRRTIVEPDLLTRLNSVAVKLSRLIAERDKQRARLAQLASLPASAKLEYNGLCDNITRYRRLLSDGSLSPAKRERVELYLRVSLKRLNEIITARAEQREAQAISTATDKGALRAAKARYENILAATPHNRRAAQMLATINERLENE